MNKKYYDYLFYVNHKNTCLGISNHDDVSFLEINKRIKSGEVEDEYYMSINILNKIWSSLNWKERKELAKFLKFELYSPHLAELEDYERRNN